VNRKTVVIVITLILAAALAYKGKNLLQSRQARAAESPTPEPPSLTVTLARGERGSLSRTLEVLATVEARRRITLSTKLAGYIERIPVHESQSVRKGDLLAVIDSAELLSALAGLEATLAARSRDRELAESILRRNLKLYAAGGLAKEALDASRVALENKRALERSTAEQIAQLRHQLSYLEIRAPFDGIVDRILLRQGDLAAAGKPILSFTDREKKLIFSYTPSPQNDVQPGRRIFRDGKAIATITRRYISAASGLAQAEATPTAVIEEPIGSSLAVTVELERREGCLLGADSLLHKSDGTYLMLYKEGRFRPLKVTPLIENGGRVLLERCPDAPVAAASEVKLARLPSYGRVIVTGGPRR
jgi:multidrug efflux pump subunit AcrA (membrane-fusion protein)